MGAFVYILLCADRSYYVGSATGDDLTQRVAAHNSGYYGGYTSTRRPVRLVWSEHFDRITDAIAAWGDRGKYDGYGHSGVRPATAGRGHLLRCCLACLLADLGDV